MTPIYSRNGQTVGWINDNGVIFDRQNRHRAFVRNGAVFAYTGRHLGVLDRGNFRDARGHVVTFTRGAEGGPVKPVTAIAPIPPIPPIPPIAPVPPVPPVAPVGTLQWSPLDWDAFLSGR